jgi:hypothetical protein
MLNAPIVDRIISRAPRHCLLSTPPSSRDGGIECLLLRSLRGARQRARLYTSDSFCDDGGPTKRYRRQVGTFDVKSADGLRRWRARSGLEGVARDVG